MAEMVPVVIEVEYPEWKMGHGLIFHGTITGSDEQPAAGYDMSGVHPKIEFMIFNGQPEYIWQFDKATMSVIPLLVDDGTGLAAPATAADLSGETVSFYAFVPLT